MIICPNCKHENPDSLDYCRYCGQPIKGAERKRIRNLWSRIPSWGWVLIIISSVILFIGLIIGSFVGIATIEGFASGILLIAGLISFGVIPLRKPEAFGSLFRGIGISFFALMGAAIDQTGNFIYNKPVEICFCDEGTSLNREENVSNPLPGTTYIQQDFTCYDKEGNAVKQINMFAVAGIRFIEYVIIAYILLAVRKLRWRLKNKDNPEGV